MNRGFTTIELLVTVSIFVFITTITLVNYPKFSSGVGLENLTYQVALSVRQAQSFGLSVRTLSAGSSVFPSYGINFRTVTAGTLTNPSDQRHFMVFADLPTSNGMYDATAACGAPGTECIELFTVETRDAITMLCGDLKRYSATVDNPGSGDCSLTSLDITFTRPNPDATIKGYSTTFGINRTFSDATIVIQSPRGDRKAVVVWSTGQISVEDL